MFSNLFRNGVSAALISLVGMSTVFAAGENIKLNMAMVVPINGMREPSGLTWHEGKLYAVSDKVDDTIYSLALGNEEAKATPYVRLNLTEQAGALDFEAITIDQGDFLLLSESRKTVLRIKPSGNVISRIRVSDYEHRNLFVLRGAGPEGIAVLSDGSIAVAAERQPCGLLVLRNSRSEYLFEYNNDYPKKAGRTKDATDLWRERDELWCLSRNAEAIARLKEREGSWKIIGLLSFDHVADSIAYVDDRYGTAEGLAANDRSIFVVLDNNDLERKSVKGDRRPLLLVFQRPDHL